MAPLPAKAATPKRTAEHLLISKRLAPQRVLQGPAAAAAAAAARRLQPRPALLNQEIDFSKNPQVLYAHVKVLEALFLRLLDSGDESTNIL